VTYDIIVGSYGQAGDPTLRRVRLDGATLQWQLVAECTEIAAASFVVRRPHDALVYVASETAAGEVVAVAVSEEAPYFQVLDRRPTYGGAPCHLGLSRDRRWLYVANYVGGTVTAWPLDAAGRFDGPAVVADHHKYPTGPLRDRQESPHPHSATVTADDRIVVADLGVDRVFLYDRPSGAEWLPADTLVLAPGSGPRHVADRVNPAGLYVLDELNSQVGWYRQNAGQLDAVAWYATVPSGYGGLNQPAEVTLDATGTYLYCSNRGHDSIAVFRVAGDGTLSAVGWCPTGGHWPRHFALTPDGALLLVANERSDHVGILRLDDGMPTPTLETIPVPSPACVLVL
jgi:6-phosphogluconolactonase